MPAAADQVQQIAVFAGRGIAPFAGGAGSTVGTGEPHIKAAPRRVVGIAGDPVTAASASVRQIMAAHRLGLAREAARQLADPGLPHGTSPWAKGPRGRLWADHLICPDQAASARERTAISGWRASSAARIAGPSSETGTNSRKRQAMISETRPSDFRMLTVPPSAKPVSSIALRAHAQRAPQLQAAGEIDHRAAIEDGAPGFGIGEGQGPRPRATDRGGPIPRARRGGR